MAAEFRAISRTTKKAYLMSIVFISAILVCNRLVINLKFYYAKDKPIVRDIPVYEISRNFFLDYRQKGFAFSFK